MKILFLHPTINRKADQVKKEFLEKFSEKGTIINVISLDEGPAYMDLYCHEAVAGPDIVRKVAWANKNGYDAIVIDCFMEPGIHAAREVSSVPVIGPFESSVSFALQLGYKFSVISFLDNAVPQVERQVRNYGVEKRLASIRTIHTPVLEFGYNIDKIKQELIKEAHTAVKEDKAEVILLGCTLLFNIAKEMTEELKVPVIDPLLAPLKTAEGLIRMGLNLSKKYLYKEPYKLQ